MFWVRYEFSFYILFGRISVSKNKISFFYLLISKTKLRFIQNISFLPLRFVPKMEKKISSTMLAPTCPTVIPSFHIKVTLHLPFEAVLVSCLFLCLRLKFILLTAYIDFKHCHIFCFLHLIFISFCSHFLKGKKTRSKCKGVYRFSVALTSDQSSKTQATKCVTALIFSSYQAQRLY